MKKKIAVITGAGGFIGSSLAKKLIQNNITVYGIVKRSSAINRLQNIKNDINIYYSDLNNESELKNFFKKISPDYIFHLATYENYQDQSKLSEMIQTNIIGTKNLLEASLEIPYTCFINTGSSSEYGLKRKPMEETDILEPVSYYAVTKSAATLLCQSFAKLHKKPIMTFRLFSVYGPYEGQKRFIPTVILSAINNKRLSLTQGKICHDFIYIDDVIEAYMKISTVKCTPGEIVNIGTGKQHSNEDVVNILEKVTGKKIDIKKESYKNRLWDTDFWIADVSKVQKLFKWKATTSLGEGLKSTYHWFKNNHVQY